MAARAECEQAGDFRGAIADAAESSDSEMLAPGWRPIHYVAMRRDEGPGFGRAKRRDVSDAGLRRAHDRDALAIAESWRAARQAISEISLTRLTDSL